MGGERIRMPDTFVEPAADLCDGASPNASLPTSSHDNSFVTQAAVTGASPNASLPTSSLDNQLVDGVSSELHQGAPPNNTSSPTSSLDDQLGDGVWSELHQGAAQMPRPSVFEGTSHMNVS